LKNLSFLDLLYLCCIPVNIVIMSWAYLIDSSALALLAFFSILLVSYPFMGGEHNEKEKEKHD